MPVTRSPFGQGSSVPNTPTTPKPPVKRREPSPLIWGDTGASKAYSDIARSLKPSAATELGATAVSSFDEEKQQLAKAVNTLKGRAALGSGDYEKIAAEIEAIAKGKKPKSGGPLGWIKKSILEPVFDPVAYVWRGGDKGSDGVGLGDVLRTGQKAVESAVAYTAESITNAPANILEVTGISKGQQPIKPTSPKEAISRVTRPDWGVFRDPKYQTGIKKLDAVLQLGTEILTDPTTYVGLGTGAFTGRAGRTSLATLFGSTEMVAKYGDDLAKAGVSLDDIARYGEWVIPKHIRQAENINSGIRFAGRTVKGTQGLGEEVAKVLARPRAAIGDALYRVSPELLSKTAFKSDKAAVALGVGRSAAARGGKYLTDEEVLVPLIGKTVQNHAKGHIITSYKKWNGQIADVIKEIRRNGWDDIYRLAENPHLLEVEQDAGKKAAALTYKQWQDGVKREVNEIFADYGRRYGVDVNEIGNVDNYIHHRMTKQARDWMYSKQGQRVMGKVWRKEDLSMTDLTGNIGAVRYRKARVGGEFMGVKNLTPEQATIDGLNKIAEDVTGIKGFKWFETDIGAIADSYIYSMAKTRGREAMARRLQDFGAQYIKPLIDETIPNDELAAGARKIHQRLVQIEDDIKGRLFGKYGGYKQVGDKVRRTIQIANDAINGNAKARKRTAAEIKSTMDEIEKIAVELERLNVRAGEMSAVERDGFEETHRALYSLHRRLKSAIERGDENRYMATMELKKIYARVYPKAKTIPDNPEVLYERIMARQGIADAKEIKVLERKLVEVRDQLDALPSSRDYDEIRQSLIDEEARLTEQVDGFERLADVRMAADYAPDGFVYGTVDNLVPLEPSDDFPYKVLYGYRDNAVINDPEAVAIHAPSVDEVVDLRNPDNFRATFNDDNVIGIVANRMDAEGLNGASFASEWQHYRQTGEMDPAFEQLYEVESQLIKTLDSLGMIPAEEGVLGADEIVDALDEVNVLFDALARESGNPDAGARLFNDMVGGIMAFNGERPLLVPAQLIDDTVPMTDDAWVLLTPMNYSKPAPKTGGLASATDEVQLVAESGVARSVLAGDYETAALNTVVERDGLVEQILKSDADAMARQAAADEAATISRQIGGKKAAGTKRMRQAEENLQQWQKNQTVTVMVDGKRTTLSKEKAQKLLASKESQIARAEQKLQSAIDGIQRELGIDSLLKKQARLEERLPTLFNQAEVLQRWNETTGELLRNEVDNLNALLRQRPPRNAAGVYSRVWQNKVKRAMDSVKLLPAAEGRAYERLVTQLHADETRLAWLQMMEIPHADSLAKMYESGKLGGTLIKTTEDGWEALAGLGVQVPEELASIWKPNLEQLMKKANQNLLWKSYDAYLRFFKTYATASVGFSVRNAMSATFMNFVAGVSFDNILDGARAARAIGKNPAAWLDDMGLDAGERLVYEQAWKITEAGGKGFGDELAEPVLGGSKFEKIINNKYTKTMHRLNDFVERSVRFPMALDSVRRGMSYDQAINRIAKYHFDYSDMSSLDEAMKRFIPFWIWTSRNVPLQITSMITRPSAYVTYDKIQEQYPPNVDLFMPDWLEDMKPIGLGGGMLLAADLPFGRLETSTRNLMTPSGLIGQMSPIPKVLLETMVADKQIALDIPFTDKYEKAKGVDYAVAWLGDLLGAEGVGKRVVDENGREQLVVNPKISYAIGNILPPVSKAQRLSGGVLGGKENYSKRLKTAWLNEFGVPLKNAKPYERGETINRQFELAALAKKLEEQGKIQKSTRNK